MDPPPDQPRILSEDRGVLALYKPAGLDVFGSREGRRESLWSWLRSRRPALEVVGKAGQPAIVHRLDRFTSGILLAAGDEGVYHQLREAFRSGRISKEYLALVEGQLPAPLESDLPIGSRYRRSRLSSVALPGRRLRSVRPAHTRVWPLAGAGEFTLCRVRITTGVRHQIRVHLSHLGFPVAGDRDYRSVLPVPGLDRRFFLHAWKIGLPALPGRPAGELACPLPADLNGVLADLGIRDTSFLES